MKKEVYSVLELNTIVRDIIQSEFPDYIWVIGEVQGLRPERSKKHTYFELVQKHSQGDDIVARARCALFANKKPFIIQKLKEAKLPSDLQNDIEVKFLCEVSLHPPTGQYSLIIVDIDPVYTLGKVAQNRQRIIDELRKRNLLERNSLCRMPQMPLRVGLITAYDSAAYHDFLNEIKTSNYSFSVFAYNAHMQGKNVEADIIKALDYFNAQPKDSFDVIVITRGGGSKADLSWFDNKRIAECIAQSKFPILTALGHQIDITITDMVAHTSVKTPTKAAQFLVERIRSCEEELDMVGRDIIQLSQELVERSKQDLESTAVKIDSFALRYFRDHHQSLLIMAHEIKQATLQEFSDQNMKLQKTAELMQLYSLKIFDSAKQKLKFFNDKVSILDPKNVLQ